VTSPAHEKRGAGRRRDSAAHRHGNLFSRDAGSMFIHMQRESGLAHRTLVLSPWQVQVLRVVSSKRFLVALAIGAISWGYFAVQAARVPLLNRRIAHLEQDGQRLDTLQRTLTELQDRYAQVQRLLTASKVTTTNATATSPKKRP
jgi:hypothetical protein